MSKCAIVGMHRSGTSLVARVANLLGYSLGDQSQLLGPRKDNPGGFWESEPIVTFHDEMLHALGGAWNVPPVLESAWPEDERLPSIDRCRELVDATFGSSPRWAWKDPRGSLLLPYWDRTVGLDQVVLVVRPPGEVGASLRTRNDIDQDWADYLWIRHTAAVAAHRRPTVVVSYLALLADPKVEVETLATALGVEVGPEEMDAVLHHLEPDARHEREPSNPGVTGPLGEFAAELHAAITTGPLSDDLLATCRGIAGGRWEESETPVIQEVARVHAELARTRTAIVPLVGPQIMARTRRRQLRAARKRVANQQSRIAALEEELRKARANAHRERRHHQRLANRRSVRAALAVANAARPVFSAARKARGPRA